MKVQNKQNPYKSAIAFMPIILMLAVVPLIVRAKIVILDENVAKFWNGNYQIDLFSYTKTRIIMLLTVFMLLNAFFFFSKKDFKKLKENKWIFYPVIVFVFSLIVSTMLSEHKNIAIWGAPERYEGMIVHLCYIIMFLYTYMTLKTEEDFKYIKYSILFLASVMAFIGLMQAFGKDVLTMDFMRNVIVPKEYREMLSAVTTETNQVYLTLQNSNYVGTYVALIIPFLFMFCISKYEHKYVRIYSGILAFITFFILVKSGSKAGLFAVVCILLLIPIIFYKAILNLKKTTIFITIAVILFTVIGVNIATGNAIAENLGKIMNDAKEVLVKDKDYVFDPTYGLDIFGAEVNMNGRKAVLKTVYGDIEINSNSEGELEFRSNKGNYIASKYDFKNNWYTLSGDLYKFKIINNGKINHIKNVWRIRADRYYYYLIWTSGTGFKLVNSKLEEYQIEKAESIGFKGAEFILSSRGYIWSRTFPLILNKSLFGHGSDNFISIFPQYDIPAKSYVYWDMHTITDKPHNIYLLYAINNGLVGLFAIVILWLGYIFITVKNGLFKFKYTKTNMYIISCIFSSIGYVITGILNDSVPVVAPIFWTILGTGFALNKIAGKTYEG